MYRNSYQRGMLTVFFSVGSKPLAIWDTHTQDGYISRFLDQDIKSMVLEIGGTNVSTTYITCPKGNMVLGITMPFLVMIVKNLKKYFSFEVTILDETLTRRRFRVSNFQSSTQILPLCTVMPIGLSDGWNQIQFNLAEFTRRAYKKQFVEVQKLKINANIRLRRIYFTERLIPEDQLPPDYKLYFPLSSKGAKGKRREAVDKENVKPSTSQQEIKPADTVPVEEKTESKTKIIKSISKASVHSIKKVTSQESRKASKVNVEVIPEAEAVVIETVPDKPEGAITEEPPTTQEPLENADTVAKETPGDVKEAEIPQDTSEPPKEVIETETAPAVEAQPTAAPEGDATVAPEDEATFEPKGEATVAPEGEAAAAPATEEAVPEQT